LIIEVLSPSTEYLDRHKKTNVYRAMPSIEEIVLVESEVQAVEVLKRVQNSFWAYAHYGPGDHVELASVGVTLSVETIYEDATLRGDEKSRGFCLSSVVVERRNEAWLQLIAQRSGGGKARNQSLHSGILIAGRCQAHSGFHALCKGKNGPHLAVGSWEAGTPASLEASSEECTHQSGGFSCAILGKT
jgi:putative restriction endonuclease